MSRVGKLPVAIPSGVSVKIEERLITVEGPKGTLTHKLTKQVEVTQEEQNLVVKKRRETDLANQQYGLTRTLLANMITGVSEGFEKKLEIHGVGYRAQVSGSKLTLSLGYSHPIEYNLPESVTATVEANTITISGTDKQQVGQIAAEIRAFRKPEPYKGKGIKYQDEHVRRKAGKTASATAGGAK